MSEKNTKAAESAANSEDTVNPFCNLPAVPERELDANVEPYRESLIRYIEKKWVNHTTLHYHFLDSPAVWQGDDIQKNVVRDSFDFWKNLGIGLNFEETDNPAKAEIRIGFESRDGSWSYVGRDCIDFAPDSNRRTMNFGWDLTTPHGKDTALHELGHALGFPHEHQNPNAGISWNEENVYTYFKGYPNYWSPETTKFNVLRKISSAEVAGSLWDKDSIMHYRFEAGLIDIPEEYKTRALAPDSGLSQHDIDEVLNFYPGESEPQLAELKPYLSQIIDVQPGQQLDFVIQPQMNRKYTIQTFGSMDTVMVLFEDINGESVYLSGDDDSGTNFNSRIEMRLISGKTYYVRLRLYYAGATGQGAIMFW